jgi:hypothetical protein
MKYTFPVDLFLKICSCIATNTVFTKEDAKKLLEFIEKHSNEYDVIADSTAYNLKQLVIEKFK